MWAFLCLWGAAVLFSYFGYGEAILRLLGIKRTPWPFSAAIGTTGVVVLGGLLNLGGLVHRPELVAVVVVGDLLGLASFLLWRKSADASPSAADAAKMSPALRVAWAVLLAALAIPVLGNVRGKAFGPKDDPMLYWAMPRELIQLGTLPSDPFSGRRISTTLGPPYFMQAEMVAVGDIRSLPFIDVSVGYILLAGLLWTICRIRKLHGWSAFAVLSLLILLPFDRINSTMVILPAALFVATSLLTIMREEEQVSAWQDTVLFALLLADICSLKTNMIPAAILLAVFRYGLLFLRGRDARVLLQALACAALSIVVLVPWMIDNKAKENTYLYPLLGRGYDISGYDKRWVISMATYLPSKLVWGEVAVLIVPLLAGLLATFLVMRGGKDRLWLSTLPLLLASTIGLVVVSLSTGGESAGRYSFGFELPTVFLVTAAMLSLLHNGDQRLSFTRPLLAVMALWVVAIAFFFGVQRDAYNSLFRDVIPTPMGYEPLNVDAELARGAAVQQSIPAHTRILARLKWSFPFDFTRNSIYIADLPGTAGLPPGPPLGLGADALRSYLLNNDIHYFALDYVRTGDRFSRSVPDFLKESRLQSHWWLHSQAAAAADTCNNMRLLAHDYSDVYDDGGIVVVDLDHKAKGDQKFFPTQP